MGFWPQEQSVIRLVKFCEMLSMRIITMVHRLFALNQAVLLLLLLLIAVPASGLTGEAPQPKIGEAAPAFNLESLEGKNISLADLRGKFVVLHFATSW
jgi:cytochrome oxidase Cu insertion factor (SCO1/SenC/PrrC family)